VVVHLALILSLSFAVVCYWFQASATVKEGIVLLTSWVFLKTFNAKSLSALTNVIMSLSQDERRWRKSFGSTCGCAFGHRIFVNYHDSQLTFLLRDSLGGSSRTTVVANVSPSSTYSNVTMSTLKFAARAIAALGLAAAAALPALLAASRATGTVSLVTGAPGSAINVAADVLGTIMLSLPTNVIVGFALVSVRCMFGDIVALFVAKFLGQSMLSLPMKVIAGLAFVPVWCMCGGIVALLVCGTLAPQASTKHVFLEVRTLPSSVNMFLYCFSGLPRLPNIRASLQNTASYSNAVHLALGHCAWLVWGMAAEAHIASKWHNGLGKDYYKETFEALLNAQRIFKLEVDNQWTKMQMVAYPMEQTLQALCQQESQSRLSETGLQFNELSGAESFLAVRSDHICLSSSMFIDDDVRSDAEKRLFRSHTGRELAAFEKAELETEVEEQQQTGEHHGWRAWLLSPWFDMLVAVAIVLNLVSIMFRIVYDGALHDSNKHRMGSSVIDALFDVFENIFAAFFLLELMLQLIANGFRYLCFISNFVDTVIVIASCLDVWLFPSVMAGADAINQTNYNVLRVGRNRCGKQAFKQIMLPTIVQVARCQMLRP
jgi:hypothetical protein